MNHPAILEMSLKQNVSETMTAMSYLDIPLRLGPRFERIPAFVWTRARARHLARRQISNASTLAKCSHKALVQVRWKHKAGPQHEIRRWSHHHNAAVTVHCEPSVS